MFENLDNEVGSGMLLRITCGCIFALLVSGDLYSKAYAGGIVQCESAQSGDWEDPSTWDGCGGGFPNDALDNVIIKTGHEVSFESTVTVYGLQLEANSTIHVVERNDVFDIIAVSADINAELGKIIFDANMNFRALNGSVLLGAVDNSILNQRITATASQNIVVADSVEGFNVYDFSAQSTGTTGKIIVGGDIKAAFRQSYNSLLELSGSVTLSGDEIEIESGLELGSHALELDVNTNGNSYIRDTVTASTASLTKSGGGALFIGTPLPVGVTTYVNGGTLTINNSFEGDVTVSADAEINGQGAIESLLTLNNTSTLSPGFESGSLQTVALQLGGLVMSQESILKMSILNNVGKNNQDLLVIQDNAQLNGILDVTVGYAFASGDVITLIDNQGVDPISGTFAGLSEGDLVADNFQISYQGGDGNDVTLTAVCNKTEVVTNNADQGVGSFRAAVENVCVSGAVEFADAYDIVLDSPVVIDNNNVSINGSGQTMESSGNHSILTVLDSSWAQIYNMTFQNTTSDSAAVVNHGRLNLQNVYLKNNINNSASGGGAISNYGNLSVYTTSFYQNNSNQGGALHNDGGNVFVSASTFYQNGNLLTNEGGAIYNNYVMSLSSVSIVDSGNGSFVEGNSVLSTGSNASLRLNNGLISSAIPSLSECVGVIAEPPALQRNFVSDGSCMAEFSGEPMLGTWGMHGGYAPTIPLLSGSPLINRGSWTNCNPLGLDQNGNPRIYGINCDIGAVEFIDMTAPQVLEVAAAKEIINHCDSFHKDLTDIDVLFSERVITALEASNYQLIHSGPDQSFMTGDDFAIDFASVTSDNVLELGLGNISTSEITLGIDETVNDGVVQLIFSRDILDEFYHRLNDGSDYGFMFRVDAGNVFNNGNFDHCLSQDPFENWQISALNQQTSEDFVNSNVSHAISSEVNDVNPLVIGQCANIDAAVTISMATNIKVQTLLPGVGGESFDVALSCDEYEGTECMGNVLDTMTYAARDYKGDNTWELIYGALGEINPNTRSVDCHIEVSAKQSETRIVSLDGLALYPLPDIIFSNGYEGSE